VLSNHYNYFRDYSQEIGRYVQADPLGVVTTGAPTPTTELNHLYAYVSSDPLARSDPWGLLEGSQQVLDPRILLCQSDPDYIPGSENKKRLPSVCGNIDDCKLRCDCEHLQRMAGCGPIGAVCIIRSKQELEQCVLRCVQDGA
jgi:RHS repeat-associated protein